MKVKFISEVSSNHNKDIDRCYKFIDESKRVGCDAVKFQLFKIDQLFAPEILSKSEMHRKRKEWELPVEFIPDLSRYAHSLGMEFSCTPFYLDAVDELQDYVDFYKVASYELLWLDLFKKISNTGKPIVLSTGMATLDEIDLAVDEIEKYNSKDITILHCSSSYPTPLNQANLKILNTFQDRYKQDNIKFGWSDHTVLSAVIYRAVFGYNAEVIEFHLDLDGEGEEYKAGHCWLPKEVKPVIENIRLGFSADGSGDKQPNESELPDRDWRADPSDGLRPLIHIRNEFKEPRDLGNIDNG